MFCVNCGKELANDARFCSFCGAPVKDVIVRTTVAEPQKEAVAENETLTAEQPISENLENLENLENSENAVLATEQAVPENEVSEEQPGIAPQNALSVEETSLPTPNVIPTMGVGTSSPANANTPNTENPNVAPAPSAPEKPERRYTLGHIFICLAAVAVMAITAGVFAGLYFSVV